MNEGYVVGDGEKYFASESDLVKYLRSTDSDDTSHLSDAFILNESYNLEEYYYTEWSECDEDYWYNEEGKEFTV